jgi:hypothetical protein
MKYLVYFTLAVIVTFTVDYIGWWVRKKLDLRQLDKVNVDNIKIAADLEHHNAYKLELQQSTYKPDLATLGGAVLIGAMAILLLILPSN